jgi:hypothetical protein
MTFARATHLKSRTLWDFLYDLYARNGIGIKKDNEKVLHLFVGSWMNAFTCCKVVAKSLSKGKVFWKTLP